MTDDIPLFEISWDDRDVQNAVDSITRGGYWANGPYVTEFERRLQEYLGVEHAITVNSGTSALVAALVGHGVGPGDEVIVPAFTFIATANAVKLVGAEPVFADIERDTYGLDPDDVRRKITPKTAAILPVHVYGSPCRIRELVAVAEEHDLVLIEDAAEALGAEVDGRKVGTFGHSTALSFCQNKIVPTGEGGAVVTDDPEVARRIRLYRSHGRASEDYFTSSGSGDYVTLGTNIRMSDLVASVGCAQMAKIDANLAGRGRAAAELTRRLATTDGVEAHASLDGDRHVYQLFGVTFESDVDRDVVVETLRERGIASKVYWDPAVHLTDFYRAEYGYEDGTLPVTEDVAARVLSLPMHPNLTDEEIDRIADAVSEGIRRSKSRAIA